jgi:Putative Actinobacterial Holin-X, holin superfamily III
VSDSALGGQRAGEPPPSGPGALGEDVPKGIAVAIAEVSERATLLVREEIELAKAEVAEKASKLLKGTIVGLAAGVFMVTALFFFLIGCAWLLYYYLPIGNEFTYFWGFFAMALILLILGLLAGLIAAKAVKRGAPPTPEMAIEEARLIRGTVASAAPRAGSEGAPAASSAAPAEPGPTAPSAAAPAATSASAPEPGHAPYGAAAPHTPEEDA